MRCDSTALICSRFSNMRRSPASPWFALVQIIKYFNWFSAIGLVSIANMALARTVPENSDSLSAQMRPSVREGVEVAKMTEGAKFLIRACIEDKEVLEISTRGCVNLIKGLLESQKRALGASLEIRKSKMMKTCRRQVPSRRGCENLIQQAMEMDSPKVPQRLQTANALGVETGDAVH
jgi:hypothetical protein